MPGPVCYGKGGFEPTVTDAALVLGYLDATNFLGGAIGLDLEASRKAIEERVARPLGLSVHDAAAAILDVVTENMVQAIDHDDRRLPIGRMPFACLLKQFLESLAFLFERVVLGAL